jgi:ABC-2 type transport system ATP-binding protein
MFKPLSDLSGKINKNLNRSPISFAIETENVSKKFKITKRYRELFFHPFKKDGITAIENITIQVKKGEIFGLLGPNGAGKTTLIKILSTLISPTSGSVFINGDNLRYHENEIKKIIGYITSEERSFYWRLTGRQNLIFFAALFNLSRNEAKYKIDSVLQLLDLKDQADRSFMTYSTGIKQKMAIARGLLSNPEILLMDEPTRSLDPYAARKIQDFIKKKVVFEEGKTVFLATHNLLEAEYLCDRLAIINKGHIIACGGTQEIKKLLNKKEKYHIIIKNYHSVIHHRLSQMNGLSIKVIQLEDESKSTLLKVELVDKKMIADLVAFLVNSGAKIFSCSPQDMSLSEIFSAMMEDNKEVEIKAKNESV